MPALILKRARLSAPLRTAGLVAAVIGALAVAARAQEVPQNPAQQPAPPPESGNASGLFGELGKLLKTPIDMLPSLPKSTPTPPPEAALETPGDPAPASPAAPPPATRLLPGFATGREICVRSANGAPDCKASADKLCQSNGYKAGKSLDIDSAYGCSPKPLRAAIAGKSEKLCGTENYVTRAFCN